LNTKDPEPLVPSVALPKGGGAIHGIGEKFQANAVTGTGSLSVPIAASPGRNGFGPKLALAYDSGAGNGPFGLGWGVGLPSIRRKTQQGLPRYRDDEESDRFLLAGAEDLVPALAGDGSRELVDDATYTTLGGEPHRVYRYRPRIEGLFARIERWVRTGDGDTHWRVITGDNTTTIYGPGPESRIASGARVFEWLIERTYDDKGNVLVYEYKPEDDAGIDPRQPCEHARLRDRTSFTQRYVKRIRYGNSRPYLVHRAGFDPAAWEAENRWCFELVFDYGEHDLDTPDESSTWPVRLDPFSTYRAGFEIRTYRLCRRILMFHHLGDTQLVRSTELHHDTTDGLAGNPIASQLVEVVHMSHEPGRAPAHTPGVRFAYSAAVIDTEVRELAVDAIRIPDGQRIRWLDLDGEGLTGILAQQSGAWFYQRNDGDGRFGIPALVASVPSVAIAGPAGEQFVDVNGNGRLDLVMWSPGLGGAYERTADGGWKPFAPFRDVPNVEWGDPQLRLVDLTGDGHPDILITEDECLCWYPSEAEAGYGAAQRVAKALDEEHGPAVVFADGRQSIFLADMCGDGLTAIVRIRNGEVCYWPNTGYGTFGAKVTMGNAPMLADPSTFDPRRIRLGDLDGTGTADLLYIGDDAIRFWRNQAGNAWSGEQIIEGLPRVHQLASVQVADLLGRGTACLVWTSDAPGDAGTPLRYVPLMSAGKPYLLCEVDGGTGAVTRIAYAPSTRFYLDDRRAGRPWLTRLPFPVHVVERVETYDAIARNRFVTHYAYHHGYFDGVEREFRGFGMVEQWDTEHYDELGEAGLFPPGDNELDEASHVPPVHTRTWFHTGWYAEAASISRGFAAEYYAGDAEAWRLADTALPSGLTSDEQREACRALKGRVLRQEVYGLDGSAAQAHPYTVAETRYQLALLQPRGEQRAAVIHTATAETLTYHYERDPSDPRIAHTLELELDVYGTVRKAATIAYPRRGATLPEQQRMHVVYVETDPVHLDETPHVYRIGLPCEQRTFELRGLAHAGLWQAQNLLAAIAAAPVAAYTAPAPATGADRRLLAHHRVRYYRDSLDPDDPLPFGQAGSLGLPHEQLALVFTQDILDQAVLGGLITPALLAEGGYRNDVDGDAARWWRASGIRLYDAARAPDMFYLPTGARDPFGATSAVAYEAHLLFPASVTDAAGNTTLAEYDYRVLAPVRLTDANGNRTEVVFDTRGMVVATAAMGKAGETEPGAIGDTVSDYVRVDAGEDASEVAAILAAPASYLQHATTFFHYDLFAWRREGRPPVAIGLAREIHAADEGGTASPIRIMVAYSDGFGRAILTKVQAEDGPAPIYDAEGALERDEAGAPLLAVTADRWVGNGATVFNNKGLPVRKYEPFFDSRPDFTDETALVELGVSPTLHYDPLGRVIRTDLPDGTYARVDFGPWHQVTHDAVDTVLDSAWYAERMAEDAAPADRDAATKAAVHAATPARVYLDTLGRPFVTIAHDRRRTGTAPAFTLVDEYIPAHTELDIEGHALALYDGRRCEGLSLDEALAHRGNTVMTYAYAMGGLQLHQRSMDAGPRWSLVDVAGKPIHAWDQRDDHGDGRGHHTHITYDVLGRPTHTRVDLPQADGTTRTITAQRVVYGDTLPDADARARNLRGKPYLVFDGAGLVEQVRCDFKGNVLETARRLFDIRGLPGWPAVDSIRPDWTPLEGLSPAQMTATPLVEVEVFTTSSTYDALNRAVEVMTPDGSVHVVGFNKANLLETVQVRLRGASTATSFVDGVDYNARGQRVAIQYANGVATTYAYDARTFRLDVLTSQHAGDTLQALGYTYDPLGNITELRDDAIAPVYFQNEVVEAASRYTYDALYRLVEASGRESAASAGLPSQEDPAFGTRIPAQDDALRNYTQYYAYDPAGNILELQHVASSGRYTRDYRYADDSNRLAATDSPDPMYPDPSGHVYTHDGNGNITSMRHLARLDWDHTDHLAHVRIADHDDVLFAYDGQRQRVRKVRIKDNRIKERIYLGAFELYREYLLSDTALREELETLHVMDGTQRICMVETPTREAGAPIASPSPRFRYQLGNHLGSATVELDELARVITYEEYHPYGTTAYRAQNGDTIQVSAKRYRYTGMERDEETGLSYHTARYYASWLARWCSADPIGIGGGQNLYAYAASNPVRFHDTTGDDPEDDLPAGQRAATMARRGPIAEPRPGITAPRSRGLALALRIFAFGSIFGDGAPDPDYLPDPNPVEPSDPETPDERRERQTEDARRRGERSRRVEDMGEQHPPERPSRQRPVRPRRPLVEEPPPRTTPRRPRLTRGGGYVQGRRIGGFVDVNLLLTILDLAALATAVIAARSPRQRVRIIGEFALSTVAGAALSRVIGGPATFALSLTQIPTDDPRSIRLMRDAEFRAAWQRHVDEMVPRIAADLRELDRVLVDIESLSREWEFASPEAGWNMDQLEARTADVASRYVTVRARLVADLRQLSRRDVPYVRAQLLGRGDVSSQLVNQILR
jgi:RHS repeat-associated protein